MDEAVTSAARGAPTVDISASAGRTAAAGIPIKWLLAALLAFLAVQNLLMWRFLDFAPRWAYVLSAAAVALLCVATTRAVGGLAPPAPTLRTVAVCAPVALLLFLLGGEGRVFYANFDWQVRDAVLRDVIVHPWPFAYEELGSEAVLRAPIGMYLIPALAGKMFGLMAADIVLLIQNVLFATTLLTLASTLFESRRTKMLALAVFLAFSGLDVIGQLLVSLRSGTPVPDHLEPWASGLQFSSHVTQAFWVPQHALAGWCGAVLFLLWKSGRIRIGVMGAFLPLLMLWSPLAIIGMIPFAAYAGAEALLGRKIGIADILLLLATALLSIPALLYLSAAGESVGLRFVPIPLKLYFLFEATEVLPYLMAVMLIRSRHRFGGATLAMVAAVLLIIPFWRIGESVDLMMRGSIPALAILSVLVAEALGEPAGHRLHQALRGLLGFAVLLGGITGFFEIRRSLIYLPVPRTQCSLPTVWDRQVGISSTFSKTTYFAPIRSLPPSMRPEGPAMARTANDPAQCWGRAWRVRR